MKFNADNTQNKATPFPAGEYLLKCVDIQTLDKNGEELRSKKSGNPMWVLEFDVASGPCEGRKLWHYLNWIPAVAGVNNGHGMALRCLHAFGLPHEGEIDIEPEMLIDKTVSADVAIEQNDPKYDPKNTIKKFHVHDDEPEPAERAQEPARAAAAPKPAHAAATAVKARAPWRR